MRIHSKAKGAKFPAVSSASNPVFNSVFNALDVGILVVDSEGFFVDMNDSYCRMIGYERKELIGTYFLNVVPEVQRDFSLYTFNAAMSSPVPKQTVTEFPILRKDGHLFGANCQLTVITEPDGSRFLMVCITDVTETNNYKHLLEETELATDIGGWQLDVQTNKLSCTEGLYKLLDIPKYNSITWDDILSVVGNEAYQQFKQAVQLAVAKGIPFSIELDCSKYNTTVKWLRAIGRSKQLFNKTIQLIGTFQDITARKMAEEELKKLSHVARETLSPVVITDVDRKIQWINAAFTQVTEYTFEEVVGKRPEDFLYGEETNRNAVKGLLENKKALRTFEAELLIYTKSGRKVWITLQGQPQFDNVGQLTGYFAICIDSTERRKSEELNIHHQRLLQKAEQIACLGSWESNLKTGITIWSDEMYRIYGRELSTSSPTSEQQISFIHPDDRVFVLKNIQSTVEGNGDFDMEHRILRPDGSARIIHSQGQLIRDHLNEPEKLVGVLHDITNHKLAEERLRHQEARLSEERVNHQRQIARATINTQEHERSEIGKELHDNVNQILASAKLFLSSPFMEGDEREMFTAKAVEHIHMAIEEIRQLSKSLVSPSAADLGVVETINDLIGDIKWAQKIEVCFNHGGINETKLDSGLKLTIYRIVQEQLTNILKYADADKICITIKDHGKKIELTISDNGKGFDPATKRKGIGFNNIINRADVFNGKVEIESSPGNGCTVKVEFDNLSSADDRESYLVV